MIAWIGATAGAVTILGVLVGGAMWVERVNGDRQALKDNADRDRKDFNEFAKEIRDKIDKILIRTPPMPAYTADSPLRLTSLGKTISDELDAPTWATRVAALPSVGIGLEQQTAYDIQEYCFTYVDKHLGPSDKELEKAIKRSAYRHGLKERQVRGVLAIVLRDKLLDKIAHGSPLEGDTIAKEGKNDE